MYTRVVLFAALAFVPLLASSQLNQVVHEFYGTRSTGEEVYRIYAELEDPNDFVSSVFGANNDPLYIGSDVGGIVNEELGVVLGDDLPLQFCAFVADVCFDSYVTIGTAGNSSGVLYHWDDTTPFDLGSTTDVVALATLPSTTAFEDSFDGGGVLPNLDLPDGVWFAPFTPGMTAQGVGFGLNNRVLLAQIAIPVGSNLEYNLNIQLFHDGDPLDVTEYVWDQTAVNPGQEFNITLSYPIGDPCCDDPLACNFDCSCGFVNNSFCVYDDCPDLPPVVLGCTDSAANNYDSAATCDNGTCVTGPDYNGDGVINTEDLLIFTADLGCMGASCMADLDGDDEVTIGDLLIFLSWW